MRFLAILFLATMLLTSCATTQQQVMRDSHYKHTHTALMTMDMLRALDQGDLDYTRQVEIDRLCDELVFLVDTDRRYEPDLLEKEDEVLLADEVLGYMLAHHDLCDPFSTSIRAGMPALRQILTKPEDVQRLTELSKYVEKPKP